jgi:hypothetical protein
VTDGRVDETHESFCSFTFVRFIFCLSAVSCLSRVWRIKKQKNKKQTGRLNFYYIFFFCIEKSVEIASRINPTAKTSATRINIRAMFKSLARIVSFFIYTWGKLIRGGLTGIVLFCFILFPVLFELRGKNFRLDKTSPVGAKQERFIYVSRCYISSLQ